jgi:hypothetical protein
MIIRVRHETTIKSLSITTTNQKNIIEVTTTLKNINIKSYSTVSGGWPKSGRHILASFDDESIVVYQAYRHAIADYAIKHQKFGGEFSYSRMSWIKPNFLWMMYRAGWATKEGQERILAVRLKRQFFDSILTQAVASSYDATRYSSRDEWQKAVGSSDVRLQWDPDHDPQGRPSERRAVQLGLRGSALRSFGEEELLSIDDVTPFVIEQRTNLDNLQTLSVPAESIYSPSAIAAKSVGIDTPPVLDSEPPGLAAI